MRYDRTSSGCLWHSFVLNAALNGRFSAWQGQDTQVYSPFLCREFSFFPVWVEFVSGSLLSYFMLKYQAK